MADLETSRDDLQRGDAPLASAVPRSRRSWWRLRFVLLGAVVVLALDAWQRPEAQVGARLAVAAIDLYQLTLSPRLAQLGAQCRFTPTCSRYAEACLRRHGLPRGLWLGLIRLARCGPWTPLGTVDPPPASSRKDGS